MKLILIGALLLSACELRAGGGPKDLVLLSYCIGRRDTAYRFNLRPMGPNQAMQRTASKAAIYSWCLCRPHFAYVARCSGLAVADLVPG